MRTEKRKVTTSKAKVGSMSNTMYQNIDPSKTMATTYVKKVK